MTSNDTATQTGGTARALVESMRPHQWLKNLFVFATPVFGKQLFIPEQFAAATAAFIAMCFAASAVYLFNDLKDLENDRQHPTKKNRPLASGRLQPSTARTAMAILALLGVGVAWAATPLGTLAVIVAYILSNVAYSLFLKHVVIVDVMFIAVGFILRILAGAFAVSIAPSYWLFLCTVNVALFLGFGKRRAELVALEESASDHRRVLEHYSLSFLDQMIAIVTSATLVCYILYTVDSRTVEVFGTHMLVLTAPFVMYGLFRYLYLLYRKQEGGSPTRTILLDKPFLLNLALWGLVCVGIIYWGSELGDWFTA